MARYMAVWYDRKGRHEGFIYKDNQGPALVEALNHAKNAKVVVILRDSEGAYHPANAGKFFLERIVK